MSVEIYVGVWVAVSLIFLAAMPFGAPRWLFCVALALGLYRLLDVYCTQLRIVLVEAQDPPFPRVLTRNLILTLVNFLELVLVFALCFRTIERLADSDAFSPALISRVDALFYSVSTATTSGFADIHPVERAAKVATIAEVFLAIVLLGVVLSLFLSSRYAIKEE